MGRKPLIDIREGVVFGGLTVIGREPRTATPSRPRFKCRCECGSIVIVAGGHLSSGNTRSCGCYRARANRERSTTHGHHPAGHPSPTYTTWANMRSRCGNPASQYYRIYGGRGISVCEQWASFAVFLADMGEKPSGCSIDRIDNERGYEPSNCRWATAKEQGRNKRNNRIIAHNGESLTLSDWAERTGTMVATIANRIDALGWSIADAITIPVGARRRKTEH